ncbi:hypothetical protein EVAR_75180_1 [Eumeta japonica]|uniref:Uncharacterized protein n=1 Tax=Eumeta variegata TaxID=151549 RepID=A0A4C1U105_EUMVA|nr:hypothetical protein EVAR_75180_1 [Eumeta japonica]
MTRCQGEHMPRAEWYEGVQTFHIANVAPRGTRANPVVLKPLSLYNGSLGDRLFLSYTRGNNMNKKKINYYTKKTTFREGEIEATGEDC